MTADRFRHVRQLFEAALDRPDANRAAWLKEACHSDPDLLKEVELLLENYENRSAVIASPALELGVSRSKFALRSAGDRLGPWEILWEIGRGGMAVVYLARQTDGALEQQAAVKVLQPGVQNEELVKRFRQEREILARLDHPHIARLLDAGTTSEGLPYLVMEYVDGEPFTTYCDRRRLPLTDRLRLFTDLCKSIAYLHQHGVIHRDIKPANVLVSKDGKLKLLDFGISKLLQPSDDETLLMTRSGLQLLTPEYASPEQVRGERVSPRTDVYGLGVLLYELLTGRRPYRIKSRVMHEVVRAICEQIPERPSAVVIAPIEGTEAPLISPEMVSRVRGASPESLSRSLRGDLDEIVLKALHKAPEQRYRSVQQFAADIVAHGEGRRVTARPNSWLTRAYQGSTRYRGILAFLFVIVVLLATGSIFITTRALLYGAVALAAVGLWYAATDRNIGRRLAEGGPLSRPWSVIIFGAALAAFSLFIDVVPLRPLMSDHRYTPPAWHHWSLTAMCICLGVFCAARSAAWLSRNRWAGRLVLDASGTSNQAIAWIITASVVFQTAVRAPKEYSVAEAVIRVVSLLIAFPSGFLLDSRLEFRDRGIVHLGRLIPWDEVESWSWESALESPQYLLRAEGVEAVVLKIDRRRTVHFMPPVRARVSPGKMSDVSSVMNTFLSDWPVPGG